VNSFQLLKVISLACMPFVFLLKNVAIKNGGTTQVTCSESHGDVTRVTAKVSGDFPGSPIDLRFGKI
jgi:hypothetical protein